MRVGGHPGTIMAKASKILAWAALTLLGLVAVLALAIALFDWNLAKPWITHKLSTVLAREIRVDGPISLGWSLVRNDMGGAEWLPQLHFTARDPFARPAFFSFAAAALALAHHRPARRRPGPGDGTGRRPAQELALF